jgi:hypothetical protein
MKITLFLLCCAYGICSLRWVRQPISNPYVCLYITRGTNFDVQSHLMLVNGRKVSHMSVVSTVISSVAWTLLFFVPVAPLFLAFSSLDGPTSLNWHLPFCLSGHSRGRGIETAGLSQEKNQMDRHSDKSISKNNYLMSATFLGIILFYSPMILSWRTLLDEACGLCLSPLFRQCESLL